MDIDKLTVAIKTCDTPTKFIITKNSNKGDILFNDEDLIAEIDLTEDEWICHNDYKIHAFQDGKEVTEG